MSDASPSVPVVSRKPAWSGLALALAIVGALATFGVLRTQYPFTVVSSDFDIGMGASDEARLALMSETDKVNRVNATIIMSIGGGLLGLALAYASVACCGVMTRLVAGVLWGSLLGAIAGWIAATAIPTIVPRTALPSLTNVAAAHALLFGLLGIGSGLMVGGFTKNPQQIISQLIKSGLAGLAGGFAYAVLVGFVAPGEKASELVPANGIAQFLWLAVPFACIGASVSKP